jgi:hypothetical protein
LIFREWTKRPVQQDSGVKKAIDIKMLLSFEEQELIEKVVKLLEPFKRATIILSSESEPTL